MTEGLVAVLDGTNRISESIFNRGDYSDAPGPISVHITSPAPPTFGTKITVTGDGNDTINAWAIQTFFASPHDDQIHVMALWRGSRAWAAVTPSSMAKTLRA
jgi:hypothetical protein